jgi:hypothetical protein
VAEYRALDVFIGANAALVDYCYRKRAGNRLALASFFTLKLSLTGELAVYVLQMDESAIFNVSLFCTNTMRSFTGLPICKKRKLHNTRWETRLINPCPKDRRF